MFHVKSKNIEIQYFYIQVLVHKGAIKLHYVSIDEQVVDLLMKPLSRVNFEYFYEKLGVVQKDPSSQEEMVMMMFYILPRRKE